MLTVVHQVSVLPAGLRHISGSGGSPRNDKRIDSAATLRGLKMAEKSDQNNNGDRNP